MSTHGLTGPGLRADRLPRRRAVNRLMEMLAWLERFVRTSRQTFLLVSHDRRFLDRTVDRLYDLSEDPF